VLFRPKSFLDQYGGFVAAGIAVFAAQLTLIVGLLAQRARRRRAEQDVRTHATRYQSVVDAQSDMICRFLPDTTLTFVNDSYCRFWNKSREEMLGHPFIEMIPDCRASWRDRRPPESASGVRFTRPSGLFARRQRGVASMDPFRDRR
jgi:PAS domain-containing protein